MRKSIPITVLLFFILLSVIPPLPETPARAESAAYACILSDDTYLYQTADAQSGLFILPYTYYVRVLSVGTEFCSVEYHSDLSNYPAVRGYCKTSELYFVDYIPARPYLVYSITLNYRLEHDQSVFLGDGFLSTISVTASYYGDYRVGSATFFYVYSNGKFGYVPKTEDIFYDLNTDYEQSTPTVGSNGELNSAEETDAFRIVVIVCLVAFALGIIYIIFRPNERRLDTDG